MAERIQAVVFDKDGTLFEFEATWRGVVDKVIDTLAPDAAAARAMAEAAGYGAAGFAPGSPIVSGATREVATLWAPWRPDLGVDGLEDALNAIALSAAGDPAALVPAAADLPGLLGGLRARGLFLAVGTNDSRSSAERQLAAAGIGTEFGFVAGYDSVARPKPAPDMVLAAAAAAGVAPASVAMVGDSIHDLQAARGAGAGLAIGVLSGPAGEPELRPLADHLLPSIEALPALLDSLPD
ncbi:MAG: HAD-IA family hydrolase [Pseudomonadota bacterium]